MRIVFKRGPIWTTLQFEKATYSAMVDYIGAVRRVTSARPEGYKFIPSYKNKTWDGYIRLFKRNQFPTGLLDVVMRAVYDVDMAECVVIDDNPGKPVDIDSLRPDMLVGVTLRSYQTMAAKVLMSHGRGVAKMATNSGKTEVIAAICKAVNDNVLVLTTKRDLMYQTSERLSLRLGEQTGYIGDGEHEPKRVTVAMIQTLHNHDNLQEEFRSVDCIMFDECHHLASDTARDVMLGIPAPRRFGFSGTPLRYDALSDLILIGATGPVLVDISNADLIDAGVSSAPHVDMFVVEHDGGYRDDWNKCYSKYVVGNDKRNAIVAREVMSAKADSTLILVDRLEHGRTLQSLLPNSIFAHGGLSNDERRCVLDMLRNASGAIVIATPIFDEGVDVPSVDLLVIAGGGDAYIRLLQRVGRGMRYKESGKLRVIDFVDDTNKYLLSHSKHRAEVYEREGFQVRLINE